MMTSVTNCFFFWNAYTNSMVDTRNIVEVQIFIFVVDVQDTPPIFSMAPPVTTISDTLQPVIKPQCHLGLLQPQKYKHIIQVLKTAPR